jgi:hypothetical protein
MMMFDPQPAGPSSAPSLRAMRATSLALAAVALLWLAALIAAAASGVIGRLALPWVAALVAAGIAVPTLAFFASAHLRRYAVALGHRRLILLHVWRVPAALVFFVYGLRGELPPLFWLLAGTGDLIAGALAWRESRRPFSPAGALRFHRFGFADFVVAVGTGLAFTLLQDPRMAVIAELPLALIPLFGVGWSGAAHLVAFRLLADERRAGRRREAEAYLVPNSRSPASPSPGTM